MSMIRIVGIDIAKSVFQVCVRIKEGTIKRWHAKYWLTVSD